MTSSTARNTANLFWLLVAAWLVSSCAHISYATPDWYELRSLSTQPAELPLHYETHGKGDPVLLIHGFGVNGYTWRHLAEPLARQARVIVPDLKGFGTSPKPMDEHYSAYDQARLVYRFIVEQDLRDLTLVGHSFGGGVALVTAMLLQEQQPHRLRRLVLIGSMGYRQDLPGFIGILRTPVLGPLAVTFVPPTIQVRSIMKLVYYDDTLISDEAIRAYARPMHAVGATQALVRTARQIIPQDIEALTARYPTLQVPTLVIWGRHDDIVPLQVGQRLAAALPDARLVVIDDSGHAPQEERPAETLTAIRAFLFPRSPSGGP